MWRHDAAVTDRLERDEDMRYSPIHGLATSLSIFVLCASAFAVPARGAVAAVTREGRATLHGQTPPSVASGGVFFLRRHDANANLAITLGLPLRNEAQLNALIRSHSFTPMSQAQFDATYAPTSQVRTVTDWASANSLKVLHVSADGLTIIARGATTAVESALQVHINDYRDAGGHTFFSNDRDPSVPANLGLQSVSGLNDSNHFYTTHVFGPPLPGSKNPAIPPTDPIGSSPLPKSASYPQVDGSRLHTMPRPGPSVKPHIGSGGSYYYPSDLRTLYDLTGHGYDGTGQTIGFTLWGNPVTNTDYGQFAATTGEPAITAGAGPDQIEWKPVSTWDGFSYPDMQVETALDTEYAHGAATHAHMTYYLGDCAYEYGSFCGPSDPGMEEAISDAANDPNLHLVSNSWGRSAPYLANDPFVVQTQNSFKHAVAVGTTFLFSSGDSGADSGGDGLPSYPSDSPYVVSVGGTSLYDNGFNGGVEAYSTETAWGGSGGGCTTLFARPTWQTKVPAATCSGRATPDLSLDGDQSTGVYVYVNGNAYQVGGTSLAAPLLTGLFAATDRYLASNSHPIMGFAAPTIYSLATGTLYQTYFNDVTCGNNGFTAGPGWDQATGWGSIDWFLFSEGVAGVTVTPRTPPSYQWSCKNPNTNIFGTNPGLDDAACTSASSCMAVGDFGMISQTTDSGAHWSRPLDSIYGTSCPSTTTCFAVGYRGAIRATTNGGSAWTSQTSPVSTDLEGVSCPTVSTCFAVGAAGTIIRTTNGGTTWLALVTGRPGFVNAISCPTTLVCYAVGYNAAQIGPIFVTTNGGKNWTIQTAGTISDLYGISCSTTVACTAVAGNTIISTTNAGATWTPQTDPLSGSGFDNLASVSCLNASSCFAFGTLYGNSLQNTGTVLSTSNGGNTWTSTLSGFAGYLYSGSCSNVTSCVAVGYDFTNNVAVILATTNAGGTWAQQTSGTRNSLYSISCASTQMCTAAGFIGTIDQTANGGSTWILYGNPLVNNSVLNGLSCPSSTVCYAVGFAFTGNGNVAIIKTVDGGNTWTVQDSGVPGYLWGIACPSVTVCYTVGASGQILATIDGGVTWVQQAGNNATTLYRIACPSTTVCYAAGGYNPGVLLATTNGGATWVTQNTGSTYFLHGITCTTTTACLTVGGEGGPIGSIFATSDGGATWTPQNSGVTDYLAGIVCSSTATCNAVGGAALITTTNGGANWVGSSNPLAGLNPGWDGGPNNLLQSISCPAGGPCYATSMDGNVLTR